MRRASAITAVALVGALAAAACSGSKAKSAGPSSAVAPASSSAAAPTVPGSASTASTGEPVPSSAGTPSAPASASAPAPTPSKSKPAVDPNAPEVVEPGDIPDNQVFIPFTSADGKYVVRVPEGWARTENSGGVTFTDKYNSIMIQASPAATAPSVESVKSAGLADVSADPTFALQAVGPVHRKAGDGILATFEIGSAPNKVTGKKALLSVERYLFFHNGQTVVLTLSGAKGADNVDPWKTVSDSLTWK